MKKKAYMYIVDVTIAATILLIGIAIMFYTLSAKDRTIYFTEQLSEDIIGVLSYTQITDLCVNPGGAGCSCPRYPKLHDVVCGGQLNQYDGSILSMFSEIIERGLYPGDVIKGVINETFVEKNVIDEKRFGFSVLFTDATTIQPLELYNSDEDA